MASNQLDPYHDAVGDSYKHLTQTSTGEADGNSLASPHHVRAASRGAATSKHAGGVAEELSEEVVWAPKCFRRLYGHREAPSGGSSAKGIPVCQRRDHLLKVWCVPSQRALCLGCILDTIEAMPSNKASASTALNKNEGMCALEDILSLCSCVRFRAGCQTDAVTTQWLGIVATRLVEAGSRWPLDFAAAAAAAAAAAPVENDPWITEAVASDVDACCGMADVDGSAPLGVTAAHPKLRHALLAVAKLLGEVRYQSLVFEEVVIDLLQLIQQTHAQSVASVPIWDVQSLPITLGLIAALQSPSSYADTLSRAAPNHIQKFVRGIFFEGLRISANSSGSSRVWWQASLSYCFLSTLQGSYPLLWHSAEQVASVLRGFEVVLTRTLHLTSGSPSPSDGPLLQSLDELLCFDGSERLPARWFSDSRSHEMLFQMLKGRVLSRDTTCQSLIMRVCQKLLHFIPHQLLGSGVVDFLVESLRDPPVTMGEQEQYWSSIHGVFMTAAEHDSFSQHGENVVPALAQAAAKLFQAPRHRIPGHPTTTEHCGGLCLEVICKVLTMDAAPEYVGDALLRLLVQLVQDVVSRGDVDTMGLALSLLICCHKSSRFAAFSAQASKIVLTALEWLSQNKQAMRVYMWDIIQAVLDVVLELESDDARLDAFIREAQIHVLVCHNHVMTTPCDDDVTREDHDAAIGGGFLIWGSMLRALQRKRSLPQDSPTKESRQLSNWLANKGYVGWCLYFRQHQIPEATALLLILLPNLFTHSDLEQQSDLWALALQQLPLNINELEVFESSSDKGDFLAYLTLCIACELMRPRPIQAMQICQVQATRLVAFARASFQRWFQHQSTASPRSAQIDDGFASLALIRCLWVEVVWQQMDEVENPMLASIVSYALSNAPATFFVMMTRSQTLWKWLWGLDQTDKLNLNLQKLTIRTVLPNCGSQQALTMDVACSLFQGRPCALKVLAGLFADAKDGLLAQENNLQDAVVPYLRLTRLLTSGAQNTALEDMSLCGFGSSVSFLLSFASKHWLSPASSMGTFLLEALDLTSSFLTSHAKIIDCNQLQQYTESLVLIMKTVHTCNFTPQDAAMARAHALHSLVLLCNTARKQKNPHVYMHVLDEAQQYIPRTASEINSFDADVQMLPTVKLFDYLRELCIAHLVFPAVSTSASMTDEEEEEEEDVEEEKGADSTRPSAGSRILSLIDMQSVIAALKGTLPLKVAALKLFQTTLCVMRANAKSALSLSTHELEDLLRVVLQCLMTGIGQQSKAVQSSVTSSAVASSQESELAVIAMRLFEGLLCITNSLAKVVRGFAWNLFIIDSQLSRSELLQCTLPLPLIVFTSLVLRASSSVSTGAAVPSDTQRLLTGSSLPSLLDGLWRSRELVVSCVSSTIHTGYIMACCRAAVHAQGGHSLTVWKELHKFLSQKCRERGQQSEVLYVPCDSVACVCGHVNGLWVSQTKWQAAVHVMREVVEPRSTSTQSQPHFDVEQMRLPATGGHVILSQSDMEDSDAESEPVQPDNDTTTMVYGMNTTGGSQKKERVLIPMQSYDAVTL